MTKSALIKNLRSNPKRMFLVDALGAILTAFMLGVVFVNYQGHIGMPTSILIKLSLLACIFAVYSFTCSSKSFKNWKVFLRIIAFANLGYCFTTITLLYINYQSLSLFGLIYFISLIIIIAGLVYIELIAASSKN